MGKVSGRGAMRGCLPGKVASYPRYGRAMCLGKEGHTELCTTNHSIKVQFNVSRMFL